MPSNAPVIDPATFTFTQLPDRRPPRRALDPAPRALASLAIMVGVAACVEPPPSLPSASEEPIVFHPLREDAAVGPATAPSTSPSTSTSCAPTSVASPAVVGGGAQASSPEDAGTPASEEDGRVPTSSSPLDAGPPTPPSPSLAGQVRITEVMIDPAAVADTAGEWVELHNRSGQSLALVGCTLGEGLADDPALEEVPVLEDDGRMVIARSEHPGFAPDVVLPLSFRNTSDVVSLRCDGTVIDELAYGTGTEWPVPTGASLMLGELDVEGAGDTYCEATRSFGPELGTPGEVNGPCPAQLSALDSDAGM